jgi:hypothetical protein
VTARGLPTDVGSFYEMTLYLPVLIEGMERHGHSQPAPEVRAALLTVSSATINPAFRQSAAARHAGALLSSGSQGLTADSDPKPMRTGGSVRIGKLRSRGGGEDERRGPRPG